MKTSTKQAQLLRRLKSKRLEETPSKQRNRISKLAHPIELIKHPSAWVYMISLWLVPTLSLFTHVSPTVSIPLIFSAVWICLELGVSLSALMSREAYSAHLQRSMVRLQVALALWLLADLHDIKTLAPWIIVKLSLCFLILMSRKWSQNHHILVNSDSNATFRGIEALTIATGIFCGSSMIYFWKIAPHFSLSESLLFILSQSSYLILALARSSFHRKQSESENFASSTGYYVGIGVIQLFGALIGVLGTSYLSPFTVKLTPFLTSGFLMILSLLSASRIINFRGIERSLLTPWRALSLSIFALCVLGSALLMTPFVQYGQRNLTLTEASFTSVSASCITGLSIIDLSQLNFTGQLIILFLIQIGGFGIILLTHMIISMSAKQLDFYFNQLTHTVIGDEFSPKQEAQMLLRFVLAVELFSAGALTLFFLMEGQGLTDAIWNGFFTAISAFCNAGFALQSDSFMSYAGHAPILVIISITVIFGGLGPRVVKEILERWRNKVHSQATPKPLSLYSRIILVSNVILLVLPTLFFLGMEWGGALSNLSPADKLTNAFFHTTSLRTAGFNSFNLEQLSDASWSLSLLLMIIGGSPFSTAGGIKVTTVVLALSAFIPTLRGEQRSLIFNRAQSLEHGAKALAIFLLCFVVVGGALFTLQCLGEPLDVKRMLFEVISALGTVGLSQGGTGLLSVSGLIVIMFCMFLGRVGPPALLLSFTSSNSKSKGRDASSYVEESLPLS